MTAKKRLLSILVAVLMVFAMMPMMAETVFADDVNYTVTVDPGEGQGTAFNVQSTTIISKADMEDGNYDQETGCLYRDDDGKVYYKLPSSCPFTAPENQEFDCWEASFGGTFDCDDSIDMAGKGVFTITALWKEPDPDPYMTLSLPDTISVRYGAAQTAFDIQVTEAIFPDDIENFEVLFPCSSFQCTTHDGTIPFTVSTNATETSHGYHGDKCYIAIFSGMPLPFNCQGYIEITSDAWAAAKQGTYTATLNVEIKYTNNSYSENKEITLTLVVPDPATIHNVTVNNGTGSGNYEEGATVTIKANDPAEGQQFKEWTTEDGVTFADATAAETTFVMPAKAVTVTATYEDIPAPPEPQAPVSIKDAEVILSATTFTYNGKVQKPAIRTIKGLTLTEGADYIATWSNPSSKNALTYTVTIEGKGGYTDTTKATYKINKAANPLKMKAKTAKVKFSKIKKKAQYLAVGKLVTFRNKGQGTRTYKLVSAKKGKKNFKNKFTVNKKNGKLTVKKGLKKGTYKVKINVTAAGNGNFNKVTKPVTVTIKVN